MWFIATKVTTEFYSFQHTLPPAYVPSTLQSNAVAQHLSPFSTTLSFLLLTLPQIVNVFPSMHFSLLRTDRSRMEDVWAQEWACLIKIAFLTLWAGALTCYKIQESSCHKFSLFFFILSFSFIGTSLQYFWLMVWYWGTFSIMITPLITKKLSPIPSVMTFIHSFIRAAFVILGDVRVFQCIDWRFVSGLYWKIHVSSLVIIFVSKSGSSESHFMMSEQMFF